MGYCNNIFGHIPQPWFNGSLTEANQIHSTALIGSSTTYLTTNQWHLRARIWETDHTGAFTPPVCFRYTAEAGLTFPRIPLKSTGHKHTKQLCPAPLPLDRERLEMEASRDVKGCCVSKDGTLVITAAERAFVPVAYSEDEIILKPKRVPLLVLTLNMQGTWGEKKTQMHADTRRLRGFLRKLVHWNDTVPLSCELVPYSAASSRLHPSMHCADLGWTVSFLYQPLQDLLYLYYAQMENPILKPRLHDKPSKRSHCATKLVKKMIDLIAI